MTWRVDRIAAIAGLVFVAIFIVSLLILGNPPMIDDSDSEIASYFSDDRDRILTGLFIQALGAIPYFLFVSGFARMLRRSEGEDGTLSTAAYGAAVATAAAAFATASVNATLAYSVADAGDEGHVRTLFDLQAVGNTFIGLLVAVFVAASSWVIIRTRVLPAWFGWIGLLGALVLAASACSFDTDGAFAPGGAFGFIALGVFLAWVLVASVLWLNASRTPDRVEMRRTTV